MKRSVLVQGLLFGAFACCFVAYGDATISAAEGVCTIDVPSGDVNISTLDLTKLTGNDLEKTGVGRLVIDTSLADRGWDGEFRIKAGYVRATVLPAASPGGGRWTNPFLIPGRSSSATTR